MIEAVSTLPVQNVSPRSLPQGGVSSSVIGAAVKADTFFISSRIRVDTDLDKAILEIRSSDTGDVIRQYPTESQIRAFQRASELEAHKAAASAAKAPDTAESQEGPLPAQSLVSTAPSDEPAGGAIPAAAPAASAPAPAADTAAPQSVLV